MRDIKRIPKILKQIEKIWKRNPDLRLGQLFMNCFDCDIYHIEDDMLIEYLIAWYKEMEVK